VYRLTCGTCGSEYIGQTGRAFYTRIKEHLACVKHNLLICNTYIQQ